MIEHIEPLTAVALISTAWLTWAAVELTIRHRARARLARAEAAAVQALIVEAERITRELSDGPR